MTRLRTCEACSRHVFATETSCPFCNAVLAPMASAPIFKLKGLSRAQRFALVAAVAAPLPLVACGDSLDDPPGAHAGAGGTNTGGTGTGATGATGTAGNGTGTGGRGGGTPQPVYGAPVPAGSGAPGAGTGGGAQPVYGAPFTPDAGTAGSGGNDDEDGGTAGRPGPQPQPLYGAPVPVYGAPIPPSK